MDQKLLTWGRAGRSTTLPRLWLFTDQHRLPDPRASVAHLPIGKAGVVLRHDHDPARAELGRDLARICQARRLVLVVAGDGRLAAALGAGVHLRGGTRLSGGGRVGRLRNRDMVTSSAHSVADLRHARAAGAVLVFLSPAFPTATHPGATTLGPLRWAAIARYARVPVAPLGGVDGRTFKQLPPQRFQAIGSISALSSS